MRVQAQFYVYHACIKKRISHPFTLRIIHSQFLSVHFIIQRGVVYFKEWLGEISGLPQPPQSASGGHPDVLYITISWLEESNSSLSLNLTRAERHSSPVSVYILSDDDETVTKRANEVGWLLHVV